MNPAPQTTAVFDQLISTLTEVRDGYVLETERFDDPIDVTEAYRYVAQVLSAASELFVEGDPEHPRMASIVTPARKLQGDNPDAIYHFARIEGGHTYRITGVIRQECYTSFTVHGRAEDGGLAGPLLGDINDRDFHVEDDGSYELILSPDRRDGNWIELLPDAHSIVVRSYFELEPSAQVDPSVGVEIDIEALDVTEPAPPLTDDVLAERFSEAVAFVRQATVGQRRPSEKATMVAPFASEVPNKLPAPYSFRDSGLPVPGAADIHYASCPWDLEPDQALVITGVLPDGPFANVMLWNNHMQTLEYRHRRASLNKAQITLEDDGSFRIVVAHRDPGVPNWLDTEGHRTGTVFWRYLLPESEPQQTACAVIPLADVV